MNNPSRPKVSAPSSHRPMWQPGAGREEIRIEAIASSFLDLDVMMDQVIESISEELCLSHLRHASGCDQLDEFQDSCIVLFITHTQVLCSTGIHSATTPHLHHVCLVRIGRSDLVDVLAPTLVVLQLMIFQEIRSDTNAPLRGTPDGIITEGFLDFNGSRALPGPRTKQRASSQRAIAVLVSGQWFLRDVAGRMVIGLAGFLLGIIACALLAIVFSDSTCLRSSGKELLADGQAARAWP